MRHIVLPLAAEVLVLWLLIRWSDSKQGEDSIMPSVITAVVTILFVVGDLIALIAHNW